VGEGAVEVGLGDERIAGRARSYNSMTVPRYEPSMPPRPIQKLLIANRGEIAVRITRACREMGVRSVAAYSEADAGALHVRQADEAVLIGPATAAESYLRGDRIVEAALRCGADAVHPGYGFLSENAEFAEGVRAAGLIFVGPPAGAIRAMGSKTQARELMERAGVPVAPGSHAQGSDSLAAAAGRLGYPVLVKAAGGGGGRGMRVVHDAAGLADAVLSAQQEAANAFGDATVFLEKYIAHGRHIEFQVLGDEHGHVVHLFERECSVQRRHQKLIEESPSPLLAEHPDLRERMGQAAVAAARAVGYTNAGTIEFIVDPDTLAFYFLEMNTRLQVEHPVTELVTGLDLVHLQLRVAAGEALPVAQGDVTARGHAVEGRVYAEDPAQGFFPSIGRLRLVVPPRGPGLRVDGGYESGDEVSQHYDAMLAKVIAYGGTRAEALARLDAALADFVLLGLTTNTAFLRDVLAHPEFAVGRATTRLIEEQFAGWQPRPPSDPDLVLIAAALHDMLRPASGSAGVDWVAAKGDPYSPWAREDGFRVGAG
jgi:acetyl-CoA carboxylase biotin carboxylase subunit